MKLWTKLIPFFVVEWLAKKYMERWYDERKNKQFVMPYKGVHFYFLKDKTNEQ